MLWVWDFAKKWVIPNSCDWPWFGVWELQLRVLKGAIMALCIWHSEFEEASKLLGDSRIIKRKHQSSTTFNHSKYKDHVCNLWFTPPKANIAPWKIMVGKLLSFWEGLFSMLDLGRLAWSTSQLPLKKNPFLHSWRRNDENVSSRFVQLQHSVIVARSYWTTLPLWARFVGHVLGWWVVWPEDLVGVTWRFVVLLGDYIAHLI